MNKKNVLLLGSELGKGGAERSISSLSCSLEQQGYHVTLCILSGTARERFYKTCNDVVFVDPPAHSNSLGKIKAWRHRVRFIKNLKTNRNIDVSISFLEGPDYINILTRGREKIVLSIRGSKMFDKVIAGWMGKVRKKILIPSLYKRADQIVCVTQALSNELHKYFRIPEKNLKVIYNFYDTKSIIKSSLEPLTTEETKIFSKPVIITSGRLHVSKAHDGLIKVLQKVKEKADARVMILGDGELKSYLTSLAGDLGLSTCDWETTHQYIDADIYFMGFQSNAFKFYRHSKIFALSSSWEGFPNVFAEALICHIPVVTTDCHTGPREILNIKDLPNHPIETCLRVPVGSLLPMLDYTNEGRLALWQQEICYWLNAPTPQDAEFEKLNNRFTEDAMVREWNKVIED